MWKKKIITDIFYYLLIWSDSYAPYIYSEYNTAFSGHLQVSVICGTLAIKLPKKSIGTTKDE